MKKRYKLETIDTPDKEFKFSNNWFNVNSKKNWQFLLPALKPKKVLEVGSFEGQSACYIIKNNSWFDHIELHCIDTWEGGIENKKHRVDMKSVEKRFDENISIAQRFALKPSVVKKYKNDSFIQLTELVSNGFLNYFDFIYIDGSHQAPDVLTDAILCFNLLKVGGVMGFDDYSWTEKLPYGNDPIRCPKISIDAFTTIFTRKISIINTSNRQMYVQKVNA